MEMVRQSLLMRYQILEDNCWRYNMSDILNEVQFYVFLIVAKCVILINILLVSLIVFQLLTRP